MARPLLLTFVTTFLLLAPARGVAAEGDVAWGAGVHLGLTLAEAGLCVGNAAGMHRFGQEQADGDAARLGGRLEVGAAVVHGLRAGLALELVITTSRSGWRPSPWRATAAVGSGALHLLATGLTAGALVSADLPDEVFGDRECYPSGHCSGTPASPLGGALIAQTAFLVFSVPYALAEIVVGVHAAKRSRPDRQRAARVQLSIGSSGVLLSGRF